MRRIIPEYFFCDCGPGNINGKQTKGKAKNMSEQVFRRHETDMKVQSEQMDKEAAQYEPETGIVE